MTFIYKIIYNLKGGNDHDRSEFPDYPDKFDLIRSNDWPPEKNSDIVIEDESNGNLKGKVIENIWNDTASIVKIENEEYQELSLKDDDNWNNGIGYFLLLPDYLWQYTDEISNYSSNDQRNPTLKNSNSVRSKASTYLGVR